MSTPITLRLCLGVFSLVLVAIVASIATYYQFRFFKLRRHPFIKKRYPRLVSIYNITIISFIIEDRILFFIGQHGFYNEKWLEWTKWILFIVATRIMLVSLLIRLYKVFYDVHWTKDISNKQWHHYIDEKAKDTQSWFILNHKKYGSLYFASKYAAIFCLISITIPVAFGICFDGTYIGPLVDYSFDIVLIIAIFVVWYKTPKFNDHFLIHKEIRNILLTLVLLAFMYFGFLAFGLSNSQSYLTKVIINLASTIIFGIATLITTFWAMRSYEKQRISSNIEFNIEMSLTTKISDASAMKPSHVQQTTKDSRTFDESYMSSKRSLAIEVTIIDFIKEELGFDAFMNHLAKEFSMENLLAIVEMTQFKQRFKQIENMQNGENGDNHKGNDDPLEALKKLQKKFSLPKKMSMPLEDYNIFKSDEDDNDDNDDINDDIIDDIDIGLTHLKKTEEFDALSSNESIQSGIMMRRRNDKPSFIDVRQDIIELPSNLPKSSIVYGKWSDDEETDKENIMKLMDKNDESKRIIAELYRKYILVGSEMELNLSHKTRQRCIRRYNKFNEMQDQALFHFFDRCIVALLRLMEDSYLRFKYTPGFTLYEATLKKKIALERL